MKRSALIACCVIVAALALLAGCSPSISGTANCTTSCHSGDTAVGQKVLAARAQYNYSGHFLGPRVLEPAGSAELFLNEGSNAMYCNSGGTTGCSKCHTDQGFVASLSNGGLNIDVRAASEPGCFTCHAPHENEDVTFPVRTQAAVALVDGTTTFNKGQGNLCVICHQARTKASSGITATDNSNVGSFPIGGPVDINPDTSTAPKILQVWRSSSGPHHGPQADFLQGANHWVYTNTVVTYWGAGQHYSTLMAPDGCVTCHMYGPDTGRLGGNLSMGGHGKYLNGAVHGSVVELVAQCKTCHVSGGVGNPWPTDPRATTFDASNHVGGDIDGLNGAEDILLEIEGLKWRLLYYFGESSNFMNITYTMVWDAVDLRMEYSAYTIAAAADGQAPVTNLSGSDYLPGADTGWHSTWEFNGYSPPTAYNGIPPILAYPALNLWQSQSFWNFKYFMEDKSAGIHNPHYAAQILYDALQNLLDHGVAAAAIGGGAFGTRP